MDVLIVGAGGLAREILSIFRLDRNIEVVGFIDKDSSRKDEELDGVRILGDHSSLELSYKNGIHCAIVAIGDPWIREEYCAELKKIGFELVTCVHPSAVIDNSVKISAGTIIEAGVSISSHTRMGEGCIISAGTTIEYGVELSDYVTVRPGCIISGNSLIKRASQIHSGCVVDAGLTVGKNALVRAGAVVLEDVPDDSTAEGVPAKVTGKHIRD